MPALIALCLSLVIGARAAIAPLGAPAVANYTAEAIGAEAGGFSITQDAAGVLYFGANSLLRFDGDRWSTNGIAGAYALRGLDFGPDGKLWVAALGDLGWFDLTQGAVPRFHSLRASLPPDLQASGELWRVYADAQGATFFSADRILRWDGRTFTVTRRDVRHRLSAFRHEGRIYVHDAGGLHVLLPAGPELLLPANALAQAVVVHLQERPEGRLLVTSKGLLLQTADGLRPFAPEVSAWLGRSVLTAAVNLPDGGLAVGSMRDGIALMGADGRLQRVLTPKQGLPTPFIRALHVDRDGGLWAAGSDSIFRIDLTSPSTWFGEGAGLPERPHSLIAGTGAGLTVANDSGLYLLRPGAAAFTPVPGLQETVHGLLGTPNGLLAAGRAGRAGLRELWGDAVFTRYDAPADVFALAPSRRQPGHLWLAVGLTIVEFRPDGSTRTVVTGLPDFARDLAEDDRGTLWIGTASRGVLSARPDPQQAVTATAADFALGHARVRGAGDGSILVLNDWGAWAKPAGRTAFAAVTDYPVRKPAAISALATDGTAWVLHERSGRLQAGAGRISLAGRAPHWEPHAIAQFDAIGAPVGLHVEPGEVPVLWIGGSKSVLRHEVSHGPVAPAPRAPLLRAAAVADGATQAAPIRGPLPYSTSAIEFLLSAPQYGLRPALRLETLIKGVDADWIPAGPDSVRRVTAIREGRYEFLARAVADTGIASEPVSFAFTVQPPWWRTPQFIAAVLLSLIPLFYAGCCWRNRRLLNRNRELEAMVRHRTRELEEASAAKTQFVANMSHDIRNPLNGIVGLAIALEDTRLDSRQQEIVATLRECTTHLSSLVDDVLDFARIEAGHIELHPRPFSPPQLLRSVVATMQSDATLGGARLGVTIDPAVPPTLLCDAGRIQQILVNLVSNAIKFAGGEITLAVRRPADAPHEVEFSVRDEGPGISLEDQAKLFSRFSRLRRPCGQEQIPGTGLGLASARLLADRMGGAIGVESRVGAGARFFLRLPLVAAEPAAAEPSLPNQPATVLIVEDADYNAWATGAVLQRLGLTAERARNGREALEMFAARSFNLVLLDRNLPDMDGIDVAQRIRELETNGAQTVLVALTAYCTAEDRARCLQSGMNAFISKPLTPEKLQRVLHEAGSRLRPAAPAITPDEAPAAELDLALLSYLADGSPAGIAQQTRLFVRELSETAAHADAALGRQDWLGLACNAHQVHGMARLIGAAALARSARDLEKIAAAGDPAACAAAQAQMAAEIRRLTAAIQRRHPTVTTG